MCPLGCRFIVVFVFNVQPTAKVIWRRCHGLKSHPTVWWSRESTCDPWFTRGAVNRLHRFIVLVLVTELEYQNLPSFDIKKRTNRHSHCKNAQIVTLFVYGPEYTSEFMNLNMWMIYFAWQHGLSMSIKVATWAACCCECIPSKCVDIKLTCRCHSVVPWLLWHNLICEAIL